MKKHTLSESEKLDWIQLIRSENVGPITFHRLLERFETAKKALSALPEFASRGGKKSKIKICSRSNAERELKTINSSGIELIAATEPSYPDLLRAIPDAPPLIFVKGNKDILNRKTVAIVGGRNASINGKNFARKIGRELSEAGLVVVSGMARGIDAAVHEGALYAGKNSSELGTGGTVAVLAGGVDVIYPKENSGIYDSICECGAVVSEMPIGTKPQASHFPRRNRIISGLSKGIVVIEATARSGSLITARMAGEQGREVFAVPGSPSDGRNDGANSLIKQGAALVDSTDDILNVLDSMFIQPLSEDYDNGFAHAQSKNIDENQVDEARENIINCLGATAVQINEIIRECHLPAAIVSIVLLELELAGRLERHAGNKVSLLLQDMDF